MDFEKDLRRRLERAMQEEQAEALGMPQNSNTGPWPELNMEILEKAIQEIERSATQPRLDAVGVLDCDLTCNHSVILEHKILWVDILLAFDELAPVILRWFYKTADAMGDPDLPFIADEGIMMTDFAEWIPRLTRPGGMAMIVSEKHWRDLKKHLYKSDGPAALDGVRVHDLNAKRK